MRSTNEIVIAAKESQPATEEELRLCICALSAMHYFAVRAADKMAAGIKGEMTIGAKLEAGSWTTNAESRFQASKRPVDEYLGPGNTPGNPEYEKRIKIHKAIFKKATGQEL